MSKAYTKLLEIVMVMLLVCGAWLYAGHKAVAEYKAQQEVIQLKANAEQQARYNDLASKYEVLKSKREENARVITKNVERIVEKPIYVNSCWELDGLHNANAAIRGGSSVVEGAVQKASGD